jgi:hypothetical protein
LENRYFHNIHNLLYFIRRYEYTRETLIKFRDDIALKKEQAAKGLQSTGGGFGGFGGSGAQASAKV